MPIDTTCNCGKRLRVADQHAGKKARCPQCGTVYVVPTLAATEPVDLEPVESIDAPNSPIDQSFHETNARSESAPSDQDDLALSAPEEESANSIADEPADGISNPYASAESIANEPADGISSPYANAVSTSSSASDSSNDQPPAPTSTASHSATRSAPAESSSHHTPTREPQWMFRSENGHIYGPVTRSQLMQWAGEGRVSAECQLQLVGGDGRWEPVTGWLDRRQLGGAAPAMQGGTSQVDVGPTYNSITSYDASVGQPSSIGYARPHRGGLIILLSILGIGCPIFSAMAWAIGYRDLADIDAGRMDPSGRGLTSTGMVLGIIMVTIQTLIFLAVLMD